ncbi:hypothetical protein JQN58_39100 [Aneurinibacillus sp. BA2021]|nr:hypothetical protein [Aneurinibacillus sp. BA2021]
MTAPAVGNFFGENNVGVILVLFILLTVIACSCGVLGPTAAGPGGSI